MSATLIERTRAAASSSASGMPSSRATSSATAGASRSFSTNAGLCDCARSTNSRTAVERDRLEASPRRAPAAAAPDSLLARHAQRLATRRQDAHLRRGAQDRVGQVGRRLDQVLAVVEDQQRAARLEYGAKRLHQRPAGFLAHAQHLRRLADHQRRDRGSAPGRGTRRRPGTAPSLRPPPAATAGSCPARPCPAA